MAHTRVEMHDLSCVPARWPDAGFALSNAYYSSVRRSSKHSSLAVSLTRWLSLRVC